MSYVEDRERITTNIAHRLARQWLHDRGIRGETLVRESLHLTPFFMATATLAWDTGLEEQEKIKQEALKE